MGAKVEELGWQVATFAADRLHPDEYSCVGSSAVWEAYLAWCRERHAVPLAFAVFHNEFEKVAEAVGMKRRQVGAHVNYDGVRVESTVTA